MTPRQKRLAARKAKQKKLKKVKILPKLKSSATPETASKAITEIILNSGFTPFEQNGIIKTVMQHIAIQRAAESTSARKEHNSAQRALEEICINNPLAESTVKEYFNNVDKAV